MRAVVQRVCNASVSIDDSQVCSIGKGLMVLLCVEHGDTQKDAEYMSDKILNLRIFDDDNGIPNLSLLDIQGELLAVSQFTLAGDARKGRRPSYSSAELPAAAKVLFDCFCVRSASFITTQKGVFQADMQVALVNDGPFTILLSSRKEF